MMSEVIKWLADEINARSTGMVSEPVGHLAAEKLTFMRAREGEAADVVAVLVVSRDGSQRIVSVEVRDLEDGLRQEYERRRDEVARKNARRDDRAQKAEIDKLAEAQAGHVRTIESLRKSLAEALNYKNEIIKQVITGEHLLPVTVDQVNSCWSMAKDAERARMFSLVGGMRIVLDELGFPQCSSCWGTGVSHIDNDPDAGGSHEAICPRCRGAGWVKTGSNDA